jgi:hypothetical protein
MAVRVLHGSASRSFGVRLSVQPCLLALQPNQRQGGKRMNPLAEMWARRELKRLERRQLRKAVVDLRTAQEAAAPFRKIAADRYRAGVNGEGFVMKPATN